MQIILRIGAVYFMLMLSVNPVKAESIPPLPTPIELDWDVSKADNVLAQEFSVSEADEYHIFVGFICSIENPADLLKVGEFLGSADKAPYDVLRTQWSTWANYNVADRTSGRERTYEIRHTHPGITIPIRVKIENIASPDNTILVDKTVRTVGISKEYIDLKGASRDIFSVNLGDGQYRITAYTLQKTTLPANITKTFLSIRPTAKTEDSQPNSKN